MLVGTGRRFGANTYHLVVHVPAVSCAWGYTTNGGAKGVGESTTSAVVISIVLIFVFDFALRCAMWGPGWVLHFSLP